MPILPHQPSTVSPEPRNIILPTHPLNSPVFLPTPDNKARSPYRDENPNVKTTSPTPEIKNPPTSVVTHGPTSPPVLIEIPELMGDFDEIHLDHQKQCHLFYHLLQVTKGINRAVYLKFAELLKTEGFIKQDH